MKKIEKNKRIQFRERHPRRFEADRQTLFIVLILFLAGIVIGVLFINNINDNGSNEITLYINNFIANMQGENKINTLALLQDSIISNIKLRCVFMVCGVNCNRHTNCIWNNNF